jgi:DUF4097 and DUF4098 domain-containing protein YvlB
LILIAIGVLFLMKNLRPELPLFDLFMTYWPALLIVWGSLRLIEILYIHFRGSATPAYGVSGGEWALIIVLTVVGSTVWGVQRFTHDNLGRLRFGGAEVFGESYDYSEPPATVALPANGRLVVDNSRGGVRITGADITEARLTTRKSIRAMSREEADRANNDSHIKLNKTGDLLTITGNSDSGDGPRITSDLELSVPHGASIEVRGRYGDIEITDIRGEIGISSDNAGVRIQNAGGRVRIDTRKSDIIRAVDVKGDLELKGRGRDIELENIAGQVVVNGSYSGETSMKKLAKQVRFESSSTDLRAAAIPGELRLSLSSLEAETVSGPVHIQAKNKDVHLTDVTDTVELDIDRGDIEIRQTHTAAGRVDAKTRSGDIELALPAGSRFSIAARTERGEVTNDFDQRLRTSSENHGGRLDGALGGGPEIKLNTRRGALTLRKTVPAESGAASKPATAPARANNQ